MSWSLISAYLTVPDQKRTFGIGEACVENVEDGQGDGSLPLPRRHHADIREGNHLPTDLRRRFGGPA